MFDLILVIIAFCFGMYIAESNADKTIKGLSKRVLELEEEIRRNTYGG